MYKDFNLLNQQYTKDGQKLIDAMGKVQDSELRNDLYLLLEIFVQDFHNIHEYTKKEYEKYCYESIKGNLKI